MTGARPVGLADAIDADRYGGKAATLAALLRAGLPVPDGVVLEPAQVDAVADAGVEHRHILDALAAALAPWGMLAVRSSGRGEDGAAASFAGQHVTRLGVRPTPGALRAAITAVRNSASAPHAVAYRARTGLASAPAIAVLVQPLVPASVSGVLFTRDPVSGADDVIIEAALGLGDAVVGGLVTPDRFRIAADGIVLERTLGDKRVAVRPAAGGGTEEVSLGVDDRQALCLSDDALGALHGLARRCAAIMTGPLDLEWAFAPESLQLLQCRPITTR